MGGVIMKSKLIILGVILIIAGVVAGLYLNQKIADCNSISGQIASLIDSKTRSSCANLDFFQYMCYGIIAIGAVLLVAGIIQKE
jgi:hypothetical protein